MPNTTTCPRCFRVNTIGSLVETVEYIDDEAVAGVCVCGEMHDMSPEMETEYWQQRLLELEQEWEPNDYPYPF